MIIHGRLFKGNSQLILKSLHTPTLQKHISTSAPRPDIRICFLGDSFTAGAGDDTAVDDWSRAPQGQLITAGRYDGLDFPGDI